VDLDQREGVAVKSTQRTNQLPACITNALAEPRGEKIRRAAENLAAMIAEMHGVPCHVRIGDDFSFALVIREFGGDDGEAG
jgi:hypothetical protein